MDRDELKKLIDDDDLGLLNLKAKSSPAASADDRLITSFREINDFIRKNGSEPQANKANVKEMMLHSRLSALRQDRKKIELLKPHDEFNLLSEVKAIESIADIFRDDDLGLLADAAESIFVLKNVPVKETTMPDYIARRKPCPDFAKFEPLMTQCQRDLAGGKRRLSPFSNETQIRKGEFFVLRGILLYVAEEGERESTSGGKFNARLRCIFDNGTESDMLLRSLAAELYKDGRRVSRHEDHLFNAVNGITADDQEAGYIYILRSLSDREEIRALRNLYKIGFSRGPVEERIKNAAKQATYLMAPVALVSAFQCFNMNPQKFENLIHHFFGSACLAIDVIDADGRRTTPREWFIAPLDVITSSIDLLVSGEIVHYRYNPDTQTIERRNASMS